MTRLFRACIALHALPLDQKTAGETGQAHRTREKSKRWRITAIISFRSSFRFVFFFLPLFFAAALSLVIPVMSNHFLLLLLSSCSHYFARCLFFSSARTVILFPSCYPPFPTSSSYSASKPPSLLTIPLAALARPPSRCRNRGVHPGHKWPQVQLRSYSLCPSCALLPH